MKGRLYVCTSQILHFRLGQLVAEGLDDGVINVGVPIAGSTKHGGSGHKGICSRLGDFTDIVHLNATIDFQTDIQTGIVDDLSGLAQFIQGGRNKALPAETRVDRHQQHHVYFIQYILEIIQRCGGIEHQAGFTTFRADELQTAIDVLGGLRMKSDVGSTRLGEIRNDTVHWFHH